MKTTDKGGLSFTKAFVYTVKDVNDAPTNSSLSQTSLFENNSLAEIIGDFSSTDQDVNDTHTYSLVTGNGDTDNSSFLLFGNHLKANRVFDFEAKQSYNIRVKTADDFGGAFEKQFVITVNNGNDAPTNLDLLVKSFNENVPVNTTITKMVTTDQDTSDTHTYSFENLSGNNNELFLIFDNELKTNSSFDYETKAQYFVAIRSTDSFGKYVIKQFTISVADSNDAPTSLSLSNSTIKEKEAVGKLIGYFSTSDVDCSRSTYL